MLESIKAKEVLQQWEKDNPVEAKKLKDKYTYL